MGTLTFQAALGGSVNLLGPNTASNINFTLPSADGTSGQPLQTNGSGTLSFANLAIANGGTGATSFTANQIHYGSFSQSAGLTFDGTNFATTGTATATKLIPTGTSVTGNGMYLPATNSVGISTAGTNAVYIDASQNVGIGTSSPSTYGKFVISATSAAQTILTGTDSGNGFIQYYGATGRLGYVGYGDSSSNLYFSNDKNAASIFLTNATERMRIDSSGNVGIGTSSPIAKLDVGGALTDTVPATYGGTIRVNSATQTTVQAIGGIEFPVAGDGYGYKLQQISSSGANLVFASRAGSATWTERMRISSTGIVTMSAYGVGTATFSASGVISSVSDETWKIKDGIPVDTDSMLKKLEPGYWYYNDEKKEIFGVDRQLGFYAQNVNAALGPEAAPTPEEGKPWGYYDRSVLAVTVMSLQKALATIETLTARIEALEAK
jgi:hypothetical protein